MKVGGVLQRACVSVGLVAALACLSGCGSYLRARGRDARQMVDIGVTRSEKPSTAVFVCGVGLIGVGAGHVEGTFSGIGGNQVGTTKCYYRNRGYLLWTYEEIGWGDFDVAKQETLYSYYGGVLGWIQHGARRPGYAPGCNHFFHLGRRGVVFNLRYAEILDFLLGWTTLDICGDDGDDAFGHWPWQAKGARNLPVRFKFSS